MLAVAKGILFGVVVVLLVAIGMVQVFDSSPGSGEERLRDNLLYYAQPPF